MYFLPDFIDFYSEKKIFLMQDRNHLHLQYFFLMLSFIPKASSCIILNTSHGRSGKAQRPLDLDLIRCLSNFSFSPFTIKLKLIQRLSCARCCAGHLHNTVTLLSCKHVTLPILSCENHAVKPEALLEEWG